MIGIIILSIWTVLGILNIWLFKQEIEDEQPDELSIIIGQDASKKITIIILLIFSPFFFVIGTHSKIKFIVTKVIIKTKMTRRWKNKGKDPKLEWIVFWKQLKEKWRNENNIS